MLKIILFFALFAASCAFALTITEAECFFDTDPGVGNGIDVTITPGGSTGFTLQQIPTTGLSPNRTHYLFTRYLSNEGQWGLASGQPFFLFGVPANGYQSRSITHAEYRFDNDNPVLVDLPDNNLLTFAALIPTVGLSLNTSHKLTVRYLDNTGKYSPPEARYFFLHQAPTGVAVYDITHIEYRFDSNTPVLVDVTDGTNINFADSIQTAGLTVDASHKLTIRYLDQRGLWSGPEARYFFLHQAPTGVVVYNITHIEYSYDSNAPVLVDVADGTHQTFQDSISTAGLAVNVSHKLTLRYLDKQIYSAPEARYFFLHQAPTGVQYFNISHVEVWFDSLAHSLIDIADAMNINFADSIPHNLSAGPHQFRLRYRDTRGFISNTESRPFFVWTGAGPSGNSRLAGAEWFVNVDPGIGHGMQVEFPQDGTWDERNETALATITGVPTGLHRFGIRFKDELGEWSVTLIDSFIIGPVLVIHMEGTNILLDWIANPDHTPFQVYRSNETAGPFLQIAETDSLHYTDVGVITDSPKKFYYVTSTLDALSSFRLPPAPPQSPNRD